jgi:hypothetical protein
MAERVLEFLGGAGAGLSEAVRNAERGGPRAAPCRAKDRSRYLQFLQNHSLICVKAPSAPTLMGPPTLAVL